MLLNYAKLNFIALDKVLRFYDLTFETTLHDTYFNQRWAPNAAAPALLREGGEELARPAAASHAGDTGDHEDTDISPPESLGSSLAEDAYRTNEVDLLSLPPPPSSLASVHAFPRAVSPHYNNDDTPLAYNPPLAPTITFPVADHSPVRTLELAATPPPVSHMLSIPRTLPINSSPTLPLSEPLKMVVPPAIQLPKSQPSLPVWPGTPDFVAQRPMSLFEFPQGSPYVTLNSVNFGGSAYNTRHSPFNTPGPTTNALTLDSSTLAFFASSDGTGPNKKGGLAHISAFQGGEMAAAAVATSTPTAAAIAPTMAPTTGSFFFLAMENSLVTLIQKTIHLYAHCWEGADTVHAKVHLLASINDYSIKMTRGDMLRMGFKIGSIVTMFVWLISLLVTNASWLDNLDVAKLSATPVYRCCAVLLLLGWLWGACVWVWSKNRVNCTSFLCSYSQHTAPIF